MKGENIDFWTSKSCYDGKLHTFIRGFGSSQLVTKIIFYFSLYIWALLSTWLQTYHTLTYVSHSSTMRFLALFFYVLQTNQLNHITEIVKDLKLIFLLFWRHLGRHCCIVFISIMNRRLSYSKILAPERAYEIKDWKTNVFKNNTYQGG